MTSRQERLPVIEMLARHVGTDWLSLCCPGHGGGVDADPDVVTLLGRGAFRADVTQVPGIDDLLAPEAEIREAQELAAETWGARRTWFLTNGTTSGVHAALLAVCRPGDVVVAPRASHRSVLEALILTGAVPAWVPCEVDPVFGCALPPTDAAWEETLALSPRPPRLALLTRPTYHGDASSLGLMRRLAEKGLMVVVDEAWGAHFGFHPRVPASACTSGADLVASSTHKTCGALSGGSMLHLCSDRVDGERVAAAVRLVTTTSPYYGVLASLDGARRQMALHGQEVVESTLAGADCLRRGLGLLEGVHVAGTDRVGTLPGVAGTDPTRVLFSLRQRGYDGYAVAAILRERCRVQVELADAFSLLMLFAPSVDPGRLDDVLAVLASLPSLSPLPLREETGLPPAAEARAGLRAVMTPREAFFSPRESVDLASAVSRVAAEAVCPYPPGIPLWVAGEEISASALATLKDHRMRGGCTQGLDSSHLPRLQVISR